MSQSIATIALVVRDYDQAIAWFTRCLDFELASDIDMGGGKRWVVVRPRADVREGVREGVRGAALLLAKAVDAVQVSAIGAQAGGRVFLFLETDDFVREHARMVREGVKFVEQPRSEVYGMVAVFEDVCGNRWDLIERV
jgi:catechol 2,3-dioxygenase-like lactoylglutathione lyase family enzyme